MEKGKTPAIFADRAISVGKNGACLPYFMNPDL